MHGRGEFSGFCPLYHRAIEIIGRRWTGAIVRALLAGDTRFCQIRTTIPGLSDRLLSERLKELEGEGIVERQVQPDTPVRIEYHLTAKGEALATVVQTASSWAEEWLADERPAVGVGVGVGVGAAAAAAGQAGSESSA